jgi:RHS repeat-associated protein
MQPNLFNEKLSGLKMGRLLLIIPLLFGMLEVPAYAEEEGEEKEEIRYDFPNYELHNLDSGEYFSEDINPSSGHLSLLHNDLVVPGTGGLDIKIIRRYLTPMRQEMVSTRSYPNARGILQNFGYLSSEHKMGRQWDIDFGHISSPRWTRFAPDMNSTSNGAFPKTPAGESKFTSCKFKEGSINAAFVSNPRLHKPDGNSEYIYNSKDDETSYALITASGYRGGCLEDGTGYRFYDPDGKEYTYDTIKSRIQTPTGKYSLLFYGYYLSQIKDKHGNWIKVNYVDNDTSSRPGQALISSVTSSDGRTVNMTYSSVHGLKRLVNIKYADKTIVYHYNYAGTLVKVLNGATATKLWEYSYLDSSNSNTFLKSVSTETGGVITYSYGTDYGRQIIEAQDEREKLLTKRQTSGILTPQTTNYFYSDGTFFAPHAPGSTWLTRESSSDSLFVPHDYAALELIERFFQTVITNENGCERHYYHNGGQGTWLSGQLAFKAIYQDTASDGYTCQNLLRTVHRVYEDTVVISNQTTSVRFAYEIDSGVQTIGYMLHPQIISPKIKQVVISEGEHSYTTNYSDFSPLGQPRQAMESTSASIHKRYTKNAYLITPYYLPLEPVQYRQISADNEQFETISSYSYYANYDVKSHTSLGKVRTFSYDNKGNLSKITYNQPLTIGSGNRYVEYGNYYLGQSRFIRMPAANTSSTIISTRVIDSHGRATKVIDFNGNETNFSYSTLNRLELVDPVDSRWSNTSITYQYLANGVLQQNVVKGNYRNESIFDGFMNLTQVGEWDSADAANTLRYLNFTYDGKHRQTFASLPSSTANSSTGIRWAYDALSRKISKELTTGGIKSWQYLSGHQIKETDAEGNITHSDYLAYGSPSYRQALVIRSPENVTTTQSINVFGDITSITQSGYKADGVTLISATEYRAYDSQHNLCKVARSDVGMTVVNNNLFGEVQWQAQGVSGGTNTDCSSNVTAPNHADGAKKITFSYDNLGLVSGVDYATTNTPNLSYVRDSNGNLLMLSAGTVSHTYHYNSLYLLEDESMTITGEKTLALHYAYDALGSLSSITYPDGDVVGFAPNGFGAPTEAERQARTGRSTQIYASDAQYYPSSSIDSFKYGNGLTHKTILNNRNLPQSIKDSKSGLTALSYNYTYDDNLNVRSITDNINSAYSLTNLTYDGLDRLKTTTGGTNIGSSSISYDGLGNITKYNSKGQNLDYNYNATTNLLTSVTGISGKYSAFAYDDRGNIYANGYKTFEYNRANQLTKSGSNTYLYDGHNRRVKQTDAKGTSYSLYSQSGTLLYRETDDGGINYIYLGKKLIAKDGVIPENSGKQHYRPFGESIEGAKDDVGYTGHKFDVDLGLSYMQARYYDPVIGRFYSNDPVGYTASNPVMSFNRYLYVNNNPYKYTDPNGEFLFAPQVGAGIIGFAIGAIAEAFGNENADFGSVMKAGGVGAAVGVATTFGGGLLGTMAVGGAANGLGEVANQAMDGEFNPEGVVEAVAIGIVGGAVAKGAAKIAVAGRGLPNNTATQASNSTTASSSQRVLADSKTLSSTPANRAIAEVKLGGAYGTGAAAEAVHQQTQCQNESC